MNQVDERVSNVHLTLLKDNVELVTVETDADGRYDFKAVTAGDYVLRASMPGYIQVESAITVVKPTEKCKQTLDVVLSVIVCGGGIGRHKNP